MQATLFAEPVTQPKPPAELADAATVAKLTRLGVKESTAKSYGRRQAFAVLRSMETKRAAVATMKPAAPPPAAKPKPVRDGATLGTMGGRFLLLRADAAKDYERELAADPPDCSDLRAGLRGIADLLTDDETLAVARLVAGLLTAEPNPVCGRTAQSEPPFEDSPDAEPSPDYWDSRHAAEWHESVSAVQADGDPGDA